MAGTLASALSPAISADSCILALGPLPPEIELGGQCTYSEPAHDGRQFELALLVAPFADRPVGDAIALIAACRDRWAEQVLVLEPHETALASRYFSLGFTHRQLKPPLAQDFCAFGFSLHNYKPAPDWLNARFWSNPERWNKERW